MTPLRLVSFLTILALLSGVARAQQLATLECSIDNLMTLPGAWDLGPEDLEAAYPKGDFTKNPFFKWLTTARDRAILMRRPYSNLTIDLTMFDGEVAIEEAVVDFVDGRLNGITVSVYNRGDGGSIDQSEFNRRLAVCGKQMGARLGVRPFPRKANPSQGMLTEGWTWISSAGMAVIEHNPEATTGNVEFLRMRMMRRDATGAMAAAMQSRSGAAVKLSELPANVKRDEAGNTVIVGIPMVDQGPKGYCVVASAQRLFEYYGIPCDQHQLAQVAESDAETGTSSMAMSDALGKIDHQFKTRFKPIGAMYTNGKLHEPQRDMKPGKLLDEEGFLKAVKDYVDDGIPLLWSLELGRYPEEPAISPQAAGGHMRMIIGYNEADGRIVFTDSWGAGHEKKRMEIANAFAATQGLYVMHPTTR